MPNIRNQLLSLRNAMKDQFIDAALFIGSDPHQNEYLSDAWAINKWLSGFTGSNSKIVVTQNHAGLWTDSRYFLQAEYELKSSGFELHKITGNSDSNYLHWIYTNLKAAHVLAFNSWTCSYSEMLEVENKLEDLGVDINNEIDLISIVWKDRPQLPTFKISKFSTEYCGKHSDEKINRIREIIQENKAKWLLITSLDDIAWTLNLRGSDIPYNPLFFSYLLIGLKDITFFIDSNKLTSDTIQYLHKLNIQIIDYDRIESMAGHFTGNDKILIDPNSCNDRVYNLFAKGQILHVDTPTRHLKAQKNAVEIENIEKAMIFDGIALCKSFHWLEKHITNRRITEFDFAQVLLEYRSENSNFKGNSFDTIVGFNANGAIVHYRPDEKGATLIQSNGILLVDSGGQYLNGTTDITRTIAIGRPKEEQKRNYTLVLKGHISLDSIIYPVGTTGSQLDVLARQHLWKAGLNYGHGTGHGVGFYLNVHEPPQGYAPGSSSRATTPLKPGMLSSNEPGYYKEGEYGIRIENLILVEASEFDGYLKHRHLSLFPIDTNLIYREILTHAEIDWLNDYHNLVLKKLSPFLDPKLQNWLKSKCEKF